MTLSREVANRLPKVELADLLVEVDRWTGLLGAFEHAGGSEPRCGDLKVHLLASVLARATNLGPANMAELSELSYRSLAWAANWYVREETLKGAIAAVVNHHHRLPLSTRTSTDVTFYGGRLRVRCTCLCPVLRDPARK